MFDLEGNTLLKYSCDCTYRPNKMNTPWPELAICGVIDAKMYGISPRRQKRYKVVFTLI